jgi:hypothetical protein
MLHGQRLTSGRQRRTSRAGLRMGLQTKQGRGQKGRGKKAGACSPSTGATRARGEVHQINLT